ncbi:MAG: ferritin-like domain-containing protein [Actinomycetales bacterium]
MTDEEALAAAISGEDACVYAYGGIGAHVKGAGRRKARKALQAHRTWRDLWQSRLPGAYLPGSAAYQLPFEVQDTESARRLAVLIEDRMVAIYADLAAATQGDERADAVAAASECATRSVSWGGPSLAFPGSSSDR